MIRVSLREMFVLVAAVALAIVSLIFASPQWQAIIGFVALLSAMIALVESFVDLGSRRAFAIGFAVAMIVYAFVVMKAHDLMPVDQFGGNRNVEFDAYQYEGGLPTSISLRYIYAGISRTKHFDAKTGQRIPESESGNLFVVGQSTFGGGGFGSAVPVNVPPGQRAAYVEVNPPAANFMVLGHFWWALLFGYIGGHFARFVYLRRDREAKSGAPS